MEAMHPVGGVATRRRFGARLRKRLLDPTVLTLPLVAGVFCLLRPYGLVAQDPYAVYIAVVLGGGLLRAVYTAWWSDGVRPWHHHADLAASAMVTAFVAYTCGWGPILSVGFLFGAAVSYQEYGSKALRPNLVWTTVAIGLGQGAIALGLAPSMIPENQAQGAAVLGWLGALFVVQILGRATARQEALETELRRSERRLSALVNRSGDIVLVVAQGGALRYASPAFSDVLGYSTTETLEVHKGLVHPDDQEALLAAMASSGRLGATVHQEMRLQRRDGGWLWFEAAITNLVDDPDVNGYVANMRDITRRKDAEDRLAHAALYDALTGLPNRTLILNKAQDMLDANRAAGTPVAALFIDIDDFKDINDTLGHEAGDQVLATIAARMAHAVRTVDTVGRLGGDEFVVLVEHDVYNAGAEAVADRIRDVLATPVKIPATATPLVVTASIGIAKGDREHPGEMLRDADIALYRAKASGKNCVVTFDSSMQRSITDLHNVEVSLHRALEHDQFFVMYQPTVDMTTGRFVGVEALLRWQHPERGIVPPNEFIPALEQSGLIVPVGEWVLHEACRQGAELNRQGHDLQVSVNISAVQLERDRIIDDVNNALAESGLEPHRLILELTETTLMRDVEETLTRLLLLKGLGVHVAIDDFGTGYSSLSYLRQFPIDVLKIDQSFVSGVHDTMESAAIVHTLVQLGKTLGLTTVAEGVENEKQHRMLQAESVDVGQGFLFARPLPLEALADLLSNNRPAPSLRIG